MLKNNGYNVKVINLLEMEKSDHYNPFAYIRKETDIVKLITNIISNTTAKDATQGDPFWQNAEGLLLQAIFYYIWMEEPKAKQNFGTVMEMIAKAEVKPPQNGKKIPSELDQIMAELEAKDKNHPAVRQYNKCMRGAGDTVRSIIISLNSRLAKLENKEVLDLLATDDMNLADIGAGVNGDGKTKTALFCVIPDSDKSYNFIIGLLYTQIFQELYYQADFTFGGRLPIHVTFMLDEFSNVALPDDYCSLLSTMRSREISSVIIIQNLAQIKALFKDTWETIPGNCDTLIYLGGNEQSTHKYISELLGKGTIDKKSSGETRGRQGSSSRNYDVLGRELYTPDEVRKLDNGKCFIFIRGFDPILDNKYIPFKHEAFCQTSDGGAKAYVHVSNKGKYRGKISYLLNTESVQFYTKRKENGDLVYVNELTLQQLNQLYLLDQYEKVESTRIREIQPEAPEESVELEYSDETVRNEDEIVANNPRDELLSRIMQKRFSVEQRTEIMKALESKVPIDVILSYAKPEYSVARMMENRKKYEKSIKKGG